MKKPRKMTVKLATRIAKDLKTLPYDELGDTAKAVVLLVDSLREVSGLCKRAGFVHVVKDCDCCACGLGKFARMFKEGKK